ncbi:30S ribosomal protein S4e [Methanomicrobiaceae archaeon CYW5]|uniref:30S ribosomal protein S4e n=1 Tax=Methanovulcanius yangii TaxID=1789227 RepID=UPI0029CA79B7|nr:30S ribosomal protein S4e [Methanovulcanius yangii]MBT8508018.1 30S ribosomal protein S4e [Methanovulcanius yangii]
MSNHLKRLNSPGSWRIAKKERTFVSKTAPGPHNASAMPAAVWLRDHMGLALTMKEVKKILKDRSLLVNGRPCRDPKMGIGVFDIVALPSVDKYYRILRAKKGDIISVPITAEAASSRLCKIADKTVVKGGKIQLNLRYGANIIVDSNDYRPKDSVVLSLAGENRFTVIDHFPFAVGNTAMVIGGRHSGKIGRITDINVVPGSIPNRVILEEVDTGDVFETIEAYIFMVGREESAIKEWGIEQ